MKIINEVDNKLKDIAGWIDRGTDKDLQMIYYGYKNERMFVEVYSGKSHRIIAKFKEK